MKSIRIEHDPKKVFFTSDTHYGHANIIKYCNRPYVSPVEMDADLIAKHNAKVPEDGLLFHMGDYSLSGLNNARAVRRQLNGEVILIKGNHEKDALALGKEAFTNIYDVALISIEGQRIWLSHYAHRVWPASHQGSWHLYGHTHNTLPDLADSLSIDCGVDAHKFEPLSFYELKAIMAKKKYIPKAFA